MAKIGSASIDLLRPDFTESNKLITQSLEGLVSAGDPLKKALDSNLTYLQNDAKGLLGRHIADQMPLDYASNPEARQQFESNLTNFMAQNNMNFYGVNNQSAFDGVQDELVNRPKAIKESYSAKLEQDKYATNQILSAAAAGKITGSQALKALSDAGVGNDVIGTVNKNTNESLTNRNLQNLPLFKALEAAVGTEMAQQLMKSSLDQYESYSGLVGNSGGGSGAGTSVKSQPQLGNVGSSSPSSQQPSTAGVPKGLKGAKAKAYANANRYSSAPILGVSAEGSRRLIASVLATESSGGNYSIVGGTNKSFLGAYQASPGWLADAGYIKGGAAAVKRAMANDGAAGNNTKWASNGGMKRFLDNPNNWIDGMSAQRYLSSPEIQDNAFAAATSANANTLQRNGLWSKDEKRNLGLLKAMHLGGLKGAKAAARGKRGSSDTNNTHVLDYFNDIYQDRDGLGGVDYGSGAGQFAGSAGGGINSDGTIDANYITSIDSNIPQLRNLINERFKGQNSAISNIIDSIDGGDYFGTIPSMVFPGDTSNNNWKVAANTLLEQHDQDLQLLEGTNQLGQSYATATQEALTHNQQEDERINQLLSEASQPESVSVGDFIAPENMPRFKKWIQEVIPISTFNNELTPEQQTKLLKTFNDWETKVDEAAIKSTKNMASQNAGRLNDARVTAIFQDYDPENPEGSPGIKKAFSELVDKEFTTSMQKTEGLIRGTINAVKDVGPTGLLLSVEEKKENAKKVNNRIADIAHETYNMNKSLVAPNGQHLLTPAQIALVTRRARDNYYDHMKQQGKTRFVDGRENTVYNYDLVSRFVYEQLQAEVKKSIKRNRTIDKQGIVELPNPRTVLEDMGIDLIGSKQKN